MAVPHVPALLRALPCAAVLPVRVLTILSGVALLSGPCGLALASGPCGVALLRNSALAGALSFLFRGLALRGATLACRPWLLGALLHARLIVPFFRPLARGGSVAFRLFF